MTSTPTENISSAVARVMPKPCARFSPFSTTKSSASAFLSLGSSAATTSRPGFPITSPMKRICIREVLTYPVFMATPTETRGLVWRVSWQLVLFYIVLAVILFWPAGTLDWWGGWVYWGEMVVGGIAICWWLIVKDPDLLRERMSGALQKKQVFWDKVL